MRSRFSEHQLDRCRVGAKLLAVRVSEQESELRRLVGASELDVRAAHIALDASLGSTHSSNDILVAALRAQIDRSSVAIEQVRRLVMHAQESQITADCLVSDLGDLDRPAINHHLPHAVLVADDYKDSRESLEIILRNAGFVVRTASNGLEAVLAAHELRPAVILMDISMPVLDGVQATKLIKEIEALREAQVIAYTALTPLDAQVVSPLFAAVLHKPARPEQVIETVRRLVMPSG